jgi:hypothetical protein
MQLVLAVWQQSDVIVLLSWVLTSVLQGRMQSCSSKLLGSSCYCRAIPVIVRMP